MPSFDYSDPSYRIKRFIINTLKLVFGIFLLIYLLVSCDVDYYITKHTAPRFTETLPQIGVTKTPFVAKNNITRNNLSLKPIAKIEITGFILFAQKDYLRTNCPYKKDLVKNINTTYPYIYAMQINNVQVGYLFTTGKRIVRQVLEDIGKQESKRLFNQPLFVTIYGYETETPEIKKIWNDVTSVYVEKIIVDKRIYE